MIEIQQLSWSIGRRKILNDLNVRFASGEFWAILGPNGAGKSSLLRFIAGLGRPGAGRVIFDGRPVLDWEPQSLAQRRALLAQKPIQSLDFLVHEVLEMGRYPHQGHASPTEDKEAVQQAIAETKISPFLNQKWRSLSGGEQQRVELARVMAQIYHPVGPTCILAPSFSQANTYHKEGAQPLDTLFLL